MGVRLRESERVSCSNVRFERLTVERPILLRLRDARLSCIVEGEGQVRRKFHGGG